MIVADKKNAKETRELSPQDDPLLPQEETVDIPEEVLEALPEEVRVAIVSIIKSQSFKGPLPPPEMLREYDDVVPGGAERIFKMAEIEQGHRVSWERKALRIVTRGQWFGFSIAIIAIGAATFLAIQGHTTMAIVLAGGGLLGPLWPLLKKLMDRNGGTH